MITSNKKHHHKQTNLNPNAPHYFPNFLTHFKINYPFQPFFYPPSPQTKIINLIYHQPHLPPHYTPTQTMLPATNNTTEETNPVVIDQSGPTRKPKPSKMNRVPRHGSGKWVWVKKDVINHPLALSCDYPFGDSTSLMIRHIPVKFRRMELMELLDKHCLEENEKITQTSNHHQDDHHEPLSEFNFLYLPIDFKNKGALGYAFVNFTTWQGALRLFNSWNGTGWENSPYKTKKIRQFSRAKLQGKSELRSHFEKSEFFCETDEYLPIEISPPRNGMNADLTNLITIGTRKWKV